MMLGSFGGDLLGLKEVSNDDVVLVGDFGTGLSGGDWVGESLDMSIGSKVSNLLGLEEVGDGVGNPVGGRVTGLSVGDLLI
jgi:hypothetical protein